ncbi:MAG: chalcone isomerase family protein [Rickettsiales bacterium]|nr:chalcone isomerase family protein [Rickettsiales bacterium]
MKIFRSLVLSMLIAFAAPLAVNAATAAPTEIAKTISQPEPYGKGKLSRMMFVAYKASLWTDAQQWSYDAPFALSITYNMGFTRDELVDRTISEMAEQSEAPTPAENYREALTKAFVDVKDGDRFTASMPAKNKVRFYHNGSLTHEIVDAVFAKRFFDIWLSAKTSEPSLRRGLLRLSE